MTVEELETQTLNRRLRKLEKLLFCCRWTQGKPEDRVRLLNLSRQMLTLLRGDLSGDMLAVLKE
jgi:hypothetical protein